MWWVQPREGECFFLRLLLATIPGATSFENLRTVNGTTYPTFKGACQALGLLENDRYWEECFTEAAVWSTGKQLRALFVTALTHGDAADPCALWMHFRSSICDDLQRIIDQRVDVPADLEDAPYDYGLFLIETSLLPFRKSLSDFGLPSPVFD